MKKVIAALLSALMVFAMVSGAMAGEAPEGYTLVKVFDGTYGFGDAEITAYTNDDQSMFYLAFECFDEDQVLEGTIEDGIVEVNYDLTGFVSGDAQLIWDDAVASDAAWETIGGADAIAEDAGEIADVESEEGESKDGESEDGESPEFQMPLTPTAEADTYEGFVRDYAGKEMWFDSTVYGGFYSAYQIVSGNGDDSFDIDAFINSQMGEKVLDRIKYELVLLGDDQVGSDYMIQYWAGRGVIETPNYMDDESKAYVTYVPDYMAAEDNDQVYPVIFDYHGGGGTMFEATDHGWVEICYDKEFMVVTPSRVDADYLMQDMEEQLAEMEAAGLPIDYTRIYAVGQSMGGLASFVQGVRNNSRIAGFAANSSAAGLRLAEVQAAEDSNAPVLSGSWLLSEEELNATNYIPFFLQVGSCDFAQLPLADDLIEGLGKWIAANNLSFIPEKTADNALGVTADEVFTRRMDGAVHTFALYKNENGVTMGELVGVEGMPHWTAPSFAVNGWEFLQKFSRVDGELVIAE